MPPDAARDLHHGRRGTLTGFQHSSYRARPNGHTVRAVLSHGWLAPLQLHRTGVTQSDSQILQHYYVSNLELSSAKHGTPRCTGTGTFARNNQCAGTIIRALEAKALGVCVRVQLQVAIKMDDDAIVKWPMLQVLLDCVSNTELRMRLDILMTAH